MSSALSMIEVRHRLAHADAGDLRDDIVQAFDVLDVERCIDIDAGGDQLLDVHVALGMAAAWCVGVRQFIDQRELRAAGQQCIEIHFRQRAPTVFDRTARDDLHAVEQRLGFASPVRLDHANDDIDAFLIARAGGGEHLEGLADARRGAEEDLQAATRRSVARSSNSASGEGLPSREPRSSNAALLPSPRGRGLGEGGVVFGATPPPTPSRKWSGRTGDCYPSQQFSTRSSRPARG